MLTVVQMSMSDPSGQGGILETCSSAHFSARVGPSKLFGAKGEEKPLEKMVTSDAIAYGNFFNLPKRGEYRIDLDIYESHKSGSETVRFEYEKY